MATVDTLPALLTKLHASLASAADVLPTTASTPLPLLLPPAAGISLLDVKNDLLLAYLQNLVFLILLKLRARTGDKAASTAGADAAAAVAVTSTEAVSYTHLTLPTIYSV